LSLVGPSSLQSARTPPEPPRALSPSRCSPVSPSCHPVNAARSEAIASTPQVPSVLTGSMAVPPGGASVSSGPAPAVSPPSGVGRSLTALPGSFALPLGALTAPGSLSLGPGALARSCTLPAGALAASSVPAGGLTRSIAIASQAASVASGLSGSCNVPNGVVQSSLKTRMSPRAGLTPRRPEWLTPAPTPCSANSGEISARRRRCSATAHASIPSSFLSPSVRKLVSQRKSVVGSM